MPYWDIDSPEISAGSYVSYSQWTRGWYKATNGSLLPFGYKLPNGYNPNVSYPLVLCMPGSYGTCVDTFATSFYTSTNIESYTFSEVSEGSYELIIPSGTAGYAVGAYITYQTSSGSVNYRFRITSKNDSTNTLSLSHNSPSVLPSPLNISGVLKYGHISYQYWPTVDGGSVSEDVIHINFCAGSVIHTDSSSLHSLLPTNPLNGIPNPAFSDGVLSAVVAIKELVDDIIEDGTFLYYRRIGNDNSIDATIGLHYFYPPSDWIEQGAAHSPATVLNIDSNRVYALGFSYGAWFFLMFQKTFDFLAGVASCDIAVEMIENYKRIYSSYTSDILLSRKTGYIGSPAWDEVSGSYTNSIGDVFTATTDVFSDESIEVLSNIIEVPTVGVYSGGAAFRGYIKTSKLLENARSGDYQGLNIRSYVLYKDAVDGEYKETSHCSDVQIRLLKGTAIDGYVYVAQNDSNGAETVLVPQPVASKTGRTPLDILFDLRLSDRRTTVIPDYPLVSEMNIEEASGLSKNKTYCIKLGEFAQWEHRILLICRDSFFAMYRLSGGVIDRILSYSGNSCVSVPYDFINGFYKVAVSVEANIDVSSHYEKSGAFVMDINNILDYLDINQSVDTLSYNYDLKVDLDLTFSNPSSKPSAWSSGADYNYLDCVVYSADATERTYICVNSGGSGSNSPATVTNTWWRLLWTTSAGIPTIGSSTTKFTGIFNGNGHSILNPFSTGSIASSLFSCAAGTIKNLTVVSPSFTITGASLTSGAAGVATVNGPGLVCNIENCHVSAGTITGKYNTGGVCCVVSAGSSVRVAKCTCSTSLISNQNNASARVGGIVGGNNAIAYIDKCVYTGTITSNYAAASGAGISSVSISIVNDSIFNGALVGNSCIFAGVSLKGTVSRCLMLSDISSAGTKYGIADNTAVVNSSYYLSTCGATDNTATQSKNENELKTRATYDTWNFNVTWLIPQLGIYTAYPTLLWPYNIRTVSSPTPMGSGTPMGGR